VQAKGEARRYCYRRQEAQQTAGPKETISGRTTQAMYVRVPLRNDYCRGKVISIKYYEHTYVFLSQLSVIQITYSLRRIILPFVVCLALPYFSTFPHKRRDFRKKVTGHKMCALISSTTFFSETSHSKINSARHYHKRT
jgi:hypothetical protein